jgi:hypothetical protein
MSERHTEQPPGEDAPSGEPAAIPPSPADAAQPRSSSPSTAWLLAGLVVLILAGVALSPFWAPPLAVLLPWGTQPAVSADEYAALAARVAAIEKRPSGSTTGADAVKADVGALTGRLDRLEKTVDARLADIETRPASSAVDVDALKSAGAALGRRLDALEAAREADRRTDAAVAANKASLQQLDQRIAAVEAQSLSRAASAAEALQKVEQQVSRVGNAGADLTRRLSEIDHQILAQSGSERKEAVEALLLLRIREAVDQARPFPAEYAALRALDHDAETAGEVEQLADPARSGVSSRAVLSKRLGELAGPVASTTEPAADSNWGSQALARVRGLVTIRRIDGQSQTGPEAAVSAAQTALTRGDLAVAVADLEMLTGPNAEAVRPWLQMARQRLSVERVLDHLQEQLTTRLGTGPPDPGAATPSVPAAPSAVKSPS